MAIALTPARKNADRILYPESDGKPIADNTLQFRWIVTIQGGIAAEFGGDPNVFVAGDLLWYPIEGDNKTRIAPDALIAFGRPKGERGSYMQWVEDDIAPQVVWEVLSPQIIHEQSKTPALRHQAGVVVNNRGSGNRPAEMRRKFDFYNRFGVEEYYVYDPDNFATTGWLRDDYGILRPIAAMEGWISPRLGIRFEVRPGEPLRLYHASGDPFLTFQEISDARARAVRERDIEREARTAAVRERDIEREAHERELQARLSAESERDRLVARLRALGIDPDSL